MLAYRRSAALPGLLAALLTLALLAGAMPSTAQPPTPTPIPDPPGCWRPPDAYGRVQIGYATLNTRTLAMLDYAAIRYHDRGGTLDLRRGITQGSYNPGGVSASFGTHDGGGAVDLSVRDPASRAVLWDDVPLLLDALRTAGFAAWLREEDALYAGSPIHIHAVAIGDRELSPAARAQIDGPFGYLRGYDGIPREDGIPQPDPDGPPVICGWMRELGFVDRRGSGDNSDKVSSSEQIDYEFITTAGRYHPK